MTDIKGLFKWICINNHIDALNYINSTDLDYDLIRYTLIQVAAINNIKIFDWCKDKNIIIYHIDIVCSAIDYGHTEILEWYINNNFDITSDFDELVNYACMCGQPSVLDWFVKKNYKFDVNKYKNGIINALPYIHIDKVLLWFKNNNLLDNFYNQIKYNPKWIEHSGYTYMTIKIVNAFYNIGYNV